MYSLHGGYDTQLSKPGNIIGVDVLWVLDSPSKICITSGKFGFDDIQFAEYCDPPLTTVSQPRYEIGRQSMLMLLDILKGGDIASGSRLLDAKLVIRESAAPPSH